MGIIFFVISSSLCKYFFTIIILYRLLLVPLETWPLYFCPSYFFFSFFIETKERRTWALYHTRAGDKLVKMTAARDEMEGRRSEVPFRLICGHTSWRRNPRLGITQQNLLLVTSWPRNSDSYSVAQGYDPLASPNYRFYWMPGDRSVKGKAVREISLETQI